MGDFPMSMSKPTLVCIDEVDKAGAAANMIYQRTLDSREFYMPEMKEAGNKVIIPHPNWVICATSNTTGDGDDTDLYMTSNVQDKAFLNRFNAMIEVPYASYDAELEVAEDVADGQLHPDMIASLVNFSQLMHKAYEERNVTTAFSFRQLINIIEDVKSGMDMRTAVTFGYFNFCSKSEQSDVAESFRTCFGRDLL